MTDAPPDRAHPEAPPSPQPSGHMSRQTVRGDFVSTLLREPDPMRDPGPDGPPVLVAAGHSGGYFTGAGERLDGVFEERVEWVCGRFGPGHLAVDAGEVRLSYPELAQRANQLARYLLEAGARAGDRIGLLFDQPVFSYVGMLAVLKINAAYVPLDVGFPPERIGFILSDAGVRFVLSLSHVRDQVEGLEDFAAGLVYVDVAAEAISGQDSAGLSEAERGEPVEDLAYLIYTSGTTGRPKGVAISHASICNFVRVAAEVYGVQAGDRMYQGMTIAFDFSVEEVWVPWMVGATLVPKPAGPSLLGTELHRFLTDRGVTAMCVVPTLLATIEDELPGLRFLLVSGEACPQDLILRWHRPGRRFLNVYGPTEATVTATWTVLDPDRAVTIGAPLPTYSIVILDPDEPLRALPHGQPGEIGIAGIGLASGYLNREDLTEKAFVPDLLGIPDNPSGRIYRTGDLGRVNEAGEIEYLGRIDLQVKIRGYRIELTEIESVLLRVPGVAAAVVDTFEPTPGAVELVGYYSLRSGVDSLEPELIYGRLRERLPSYMVPVYLQHLEVIPMTTSDKADRAALPAPTTRRSTPPGGYVAPATDTEQVLADTLAGVLGVEQVSVHSNIFDDLGANSLLMARFAAQVREQAALPSISMRQIYQNPTIRELAEAIGGRAVSGRAPAPSVDSAATVRPGAVGSGTVVRTSGAKYVATGVAQLLCMLAAAYLGALLIDTSFTWSAAGATPVEVFWRAAGITGALFLTACLLPIPAKWLLVGRWKEQEFGLWSLAYLRFWLIRSLMAVNPLLLFTGSPVYPLYLRAMGAKIGKDVTILTGSVPVTTDLVTIGAGTVIRRGASLTGYRATSGTLQIGRVALGRDVFIGEASMLDINTSMGDGATLGHSSALHNGQHIPAGESWHGIPAEPTTTNYRTVARIRLHPARRFLFGLVHLVSVMVLVPVGSGVAITLLTAVPLVSVYFDPSKLQLTGARFYLTMTAISATVFLAGTLLGLLAMITLPRVLQSMIRPGRTYRLYGLHYVAASLIMGLSNSKFFMTIFGDSSAAVGYARALGYHLDQVEQTGSNFGTEIYHDSALLTSVGRGTMLSDGLSIVNSDWSSTSFKMSRIAIGERNFMGNNIVLPADAKIGRNVLLGTRVMVPIDGPIRENVGLLGSPPIEIPRSVTRDHQFDHLKTPEELPRRLRAKLRHNIASMATFMMFTWARFAAMAVLLAGAAGLYHRWGHAAIAVGFVAMLLSNILIAAFAERAVMGFHRLIPRFVSMYDPYFWRHERLWKVLATASPIFAGTPFRALNWRLFGVRVGKRLFDDGAAIPEKTLVTLGDDVVLNTGAVIQCHSLEEGTFKSDHTVLGDGVVLADGAFVHYGVSMGEGTILGVNAFLMKGEQTTPHTEWAGNPATELQPVAPVSDEAPTKPIPATEIELATGIGHDLATTPNPIAPALIGRAD
jgi:non-ribosomal peptide synthetase-like protein